MPIPKNQPLGVDAPDVKFHQIIPTPKQKPQQAQQRFDREIDTIISPPAAPSSGGSFQFPFQIQIVDPTTINVRYATVQDIIPTDIATDLNPTDNATTVYYIEVEIDIDGVVIGVILDSGSSQPSGRRRSSNQGGSIRVLGVLIWNGLRKTRAYSISRCRAADAVRIPCGIGVKTDLVSLQGQQEACQILSRGI